MKKCGQHHWNLKICKKLKKTKKKKEIFKLRSFAHEVKIATIGSIWFAVLFKLYTTALSGTCQTLNAFVAQHSTYGYAYIHECSNICGWKIGLKLNQYLMFCK